MSLKDKLVVGCLVAIATSQVVQGTMMVYIMLVNLGIISL